MTSADVIRVIAIWTAPEGSEDQVRSLLAELAGLTRAEPGCLRFEVWESPEVARRFVLIEDYDGPLGRASHLESDHFRDLVTGRAVALGVERDVHVYVPLTGNQ